VPEHRTSGHARLRPAIGTAIGMLAVTNVLLGGLLMHQAHDSSTNLAATPLPAIFIPIPPTAAVPEFTRPPERAQRQQAKARPPVLLGPKNLAISLTAYCTDVVAGATAASVTAGGWVCDRPPAAARAVNMDAACRWLYGKDAWSGMLADTHQRSWRCYRNPS
jgi:predicted NBD/HSP70 family sugar kinase